MSASKAIQQLNRLIGVTASTKPLTTVQIDTFARFLSVASQKKANSVLALVQDKLGPENYSLLMERILAHKGLSPIKSYDLGAAPTHRNITRAMKIEHGGQEAPIRPTETGGFTQRRIEGPYGDLDDIGLVGDRLGEAETRSREFESAMDFAAGIGTTRDPIRIKSLKGLAPLDPVLRNAALGAMQAPLMQRGKRTFRGIRDGLPLGSKVRGEFSPEEIKKTINLSKDLPKEFAGERNTALFGNKTPLDSSRNPLIELMRGQQIEGQQNFRPLEYLDKETLQRMLSQGNLY